MLHFLALAHPVSACSSKPIFWLFWSVRMSKRFFILCLAQSINSRLGSFGNCRRVHNATSGLNFFLFSILLQQKENNCLGLSAVELLETVFLQMSLLSPFVACHLRYPPVPFDASWLRGSWCGDVCVSNNLVGWWLQPLLSIYRQVSQGLWAPHSSVELS